MTHGTQGQQWIDDEIRKAERMTNETEAPERMMEKVDISPEAVETRALCHDQFVGCDYDMTMTQDGHQKTASTLRAQAARIAELEVVVKAYLEAAADAAGGAPDKYAEERRAFLALRCAVNWPTKASCAELTNNPTERETP